MFKSGTSTGVTNICFSTVGHGTDVIFFKYINIKRYSVPSTAKRKWPAAHRIPEMEKIAARYMYLPVRR